MKKYSDLEFLKLSKGQKFVYRLTSFFAAIPRAIARFFLAIGRFFKNAALGIGREFADIFTTFKEGDWKTRASFLVMGLGSIARGQVLRGLMFLLFEAVFLFYMITTGGYWLSLLPSLGRIGPHEEYNAVLDAYTTAYGDNSFKILLYGVLTIFFIVAFLYTWRLNVKQNKIAQEYQRAGRRLKSSADDLRSLVDEQFYKTLLALPLTGIVVFTVLPIVFMILVAFTNYDGAHNGYTNALFSWQGLANFRTLLTWTGSGVNYSATFGEILTWTLIWAFFATFTNYFLGMFVAMMINKKGIRLKKLWRTVLVMTIAIPQFISLLYVSKMFAKNGIVNGLLLNWGWIDKAIDFWGSTAPDADRHRYSDEHPRRPLRVLPHRRRQRLAAVHEDHAALHAVHHGPVSADELHRQHEQLQRHLPAHRRRADQRGGLGRGGQCGLYRPARDLAVQDHHRRGSAVLSRLGGRHHGLRGGRGDLPRGVQCAALYQK